MQFDFKKFDDDMAKLESQVANDPVDVEVVKAASKGIHMILESHGDVQSPETDVKPAMESAEVTKKLTLPQRVSNWWGKKRAELESAIGERDLVKIEAIESEVTSAKAFLEGLGYKVDSIMY